MESLVDVERSAEIGSKLEARSTEHTPLIVAHQPLTTFLKEVYVEDDDLNDHVADGDAEGHV